MYLPETLIKTINYRDQNFFESVSWNLSNGIHSVKDFEESWIKIIVARSIQVDKKNLFSGVQKKSRRRGGRGEEWFHQTKEIFKELVLFADSQKDLSLRLELYSLLAYLKQESSIFRIRLLDLYSICNNVLPKSVSPIFIKYILENKSIDRLGFKLSATEHLSRTKAVNLAGEHLSYRVAYNKLLPEVRVLVGCSTVDNLLFDSSQNEFDAYVTIPGLSLRHISKDFLYAIYKEILLAGMTLTAEHRLHINICVGFVDYLRIVGAKDILKKPTLENKILFLIERAQRATREVSFEAHNAYFALMPCGFPVPDIQRPTVNGIIPYWPENKELGNTINEALASSGTTETRRFILPELQADSLIHEHEIHPKLGEKFLIK